MKLFFPTIKRIMEDSIKSRVSAIPKDRRLISMFLDHAIMIGIIVPLMIILALIGTEYPNMMSNEMGIFIFYSFVFLYLNKDFVGGKSLAKRIMGFQVIDRKTGENASELQCFVRNLTICVAWPIEVIICLIYPQRRIGDFLANTQIVKNEKLGAKSIFKDLKRLKLRWTYILIVLMAFVYFYLLDQTMSEDSF